MPGRADLIAEAQKLGLAREVEIHKRITVSVSKATAEAKAKQAAREARNKELRPTPPPLDSLAQQLKEAIAAGDDILADLIKEQLEHFASVRR